MSTHITNVNHNAVLAAIFDPATGPAELPAKTGLSLHELARWLKTNAAMVAEVREFLVVRATLVASRLHLSSLNALERVTRESPDLERVRKAASTILRSLKSPAASPSKASEPTRSRGPTGEGVPPVPSCSTDSINDAVIPKRASVAERLAAMRLAKLESSRTLPAHPPQ